MPRSGQTFTNRHIVVKTMLSPFHILQTGKRRSSLVALGGWVAQEQRARSLPLAWAWARLSPSLHCCHFVLLAHWRDTDKSQGTGEHISAHRRGSKQAQCQNPLLCALCNLVDLQVSCRISLWCWNLSHYNGIPPGFTKTGPLCLHFPSFRLFSVPSKAKLPIWPCWPADLESPSGAILHLQLSLSFGFLF